MVRQNIARVAAIVALAAMAVTGANSGRVAQARAQTRVLFAFGREGGNMRPLTVTIDATGAVSTSYSIDGARPIQLSRDALDGLRTLAAAEGFATMPARIVGRGLPDVGGRFITVRGASGLKTVHVRFVRNTAFDQLYAVLSVAAGMGS